MRRNTKQREAILRFLRGTKTHPTAGEIYEAVRRTAPGISKGTVYRNLQVLLQEWAISVLDIAGTQSRYEVKQPPHYHFRCDQCGRVFDLDEPVNDEINARVARKTGYRVLHHQTEFGGLCNDCQALEK